jgi:hypothetical protein
LVSIGRENIRVSIYEAAVRGAEHSRIYGARVKVALRPLCFLRIIPDECDRNIVAVKDGDASFQLGDDGVFSVKAHTGMATGDAV